MRWALATCGWVLQLVRQRGRGFRVLPKRWIVERTHSWLNRFRRLLVRWEKHAELYLAFVHLACAQPIFDGVVSFFELPSDAICAHIGEGEVAVLKASSTRDLAAAPRIPSVVIFLASDPARWTPLDSSRHRALGSGFAPGRPISAARVAATATDLQETATVGYAGR